jgi:2,4-dienoyl-CoA reductase-like NADH-dependent reductase (Old Yellow Enzyme family)
MPGPSPVYTPLLTVEHVAEAERIASQHQAPYAHVQRARLALRLQAEPELDNVTLAREFGQHPNWVRKWRQRWSREGFSLEDKKGRGRKPLFSPLGAQPGQSHCL